MHEGQAKRDGSYHSRNRPRVVSLFYDAGMGLKPVGAPHPQPHARGDEHHAQRCQGQGPDTAEGEVFEIHPKETRQEGERHKNRRDRRQAFHDLVKGVGDVGEMDFQGVGESVALHL